MKGRFRKGKKAAHKFDGFEWEVRISGKQRKLAHRYNRFHNARLDTMLAEYEDDDNSMHWMCSCGHYEESGLHCSFCGNEPPWGCDCSFCNERAYQEDADQFDIGDWPIYYPEENN